MNDAVKIQLQVKECEKLLYGVIRYHGMQLLRYDGFCPYTT